jgi:hypothetical protein
MTFSLPTLPFREQDPPMRMTPNTSVCAFALLLVAGCSPPPPTSEPRSEAPPQDILLGKSPPSGAGDAPEISRSVGAEGGVVVLWPRIVRTKGNSGPVDDETRDIAAKLQKRLEEVAAKALPGAPTDVRPEPERVCPRQGCKAISVGVLLTRAQGACAAMALVSAPGASPAKIVPWAGRVNVQQDTVAFRDPPETQVRVEDYVSCAKLIDELGSREAEVAAAIRAVAPAK